MSAYKQLESLVKRLDRKYPEAKLTVGYLGNVTLRGDARVWYVFSKLSTPKSYGHKSYNWGGYSGEEATEKLWKWASSNLEKAVKKAVAENDGPYKGPAPYRGPFMAARRVADRWLQKVATMKPDQS